MESQRSEQMSRPDVAALAKAVASVRTEEEAAALLVDLCTVREVDELAQRLQVAALLDGGQSYSAVQQATGASSTTVSRVSKYLNGEAGGYRMVLDRLGEDGSGATEQ